MALVLLFAAGCLSRYLDAPYVLTTGLVGADRMGWGATPGTFLVSTPSGNKLVDQTGQISASLVPPPEHPALHDGAIVSIETKAGVVWVDAAGTLRVGETTIVTGLSRPRGLTCDRNERLYIVSGAEEPALYRVDGGQLTLIAEWVGPVEDVAWGSGGWLDPENLYLVRSDGVLEFLRPP